MTKSMCWWFGLFLASFTMTVSCGTQGKKKSSGSPNGKLESAFRKAAADSGVPYRHLLAVAYIESRMNTQKGTALYKLTGEGTGTMERSLRGMETAFGLSYEELSIQDHPEQSTFATQVEAYGKYVKSKLTGSGATLNPNPGNVEEKVRWIWELAQIQRKNSKDRKNIWVIFSKEMLSVLNEGFHWQERETGEVLKLDKEPTPIKESDLPQELQSMFQLTTPLRSEIRPAYVYTLATQPAKKPLKNNPQRIIVMHCPLSLSACLQMQIEEPKDNAYLGTHYVIASDDQYVPGIMQVNFHEDAVALTQPTGELKTVQDAVVIMLVGQSGTYVKGVRKPAIPMWMTADQLRLLGVAIDHICTELSYRNENFNREACMAVGSDKDKGVSFRIQTPGHPYHWGDIPDYEETIFAPYLAGGGEGPQGQTFIELPGNRTIYQAGEKIPLKLVFQPLTKEIELERMVRCPDQRVVWERISREQVRGVTSRAYDSLTFYDAGPNGNGDQYFRVKAYGDDRSMLGWSTQGINLEKFEKPQSTVVSKDCL